MRFDRTLRLSASMGFPMLAILAFATCGGGYSSSGSTYAPPPPNPNPVFFPSPQNTYGQVNAACPGGGNVTTQTLLAWGGAPSSGYTWTLANGTTFPPGTTVDPLTGIFHSNGGAVIAGNYTFQMTASDGSTSSTGSFSCTIAPDDNSGVCGQAVFEQSNLANIQLPDAKTGQGYGACLYSDGEGALPYTWSVVSGSLPGGLVLDASRGVVRGTPFSSAAGSSYTFSVKIVDTNGQVAQPGASYTIKVPN